MPDNDEATLIDAIDACETNMLRWMTEQRATFPAMTIAVGEYGREVRASAAIKAGALVLHVPKAMMLTVERARESAIGKLIAGSRSNISDYGYLAAWLLELKREGGFWQPYLDVLPQDFSDHPYFFSDADLAFLQGSHLQPKMRRRRARAEFEFHQIRRLLPADRAFTLDDYAWARAVVVTRVHAAVIAGKKGTAMVPLADMANHSAKPNLHWQPESSLGFMYIAARDIEAGEPLTISYGAEANGHWFSTYGFCVDNNPYDTAEIVLPSLPADHPYLEQANDLGYVRDDKRVFAVRANCSHRATRDLLSYLRLLVMNDASAVTPGKDDGGSVEVASAGIETEQAALCELAMACQRLLRAFPTSIEQDEVLLKDEALPLKLRTTVQVRHGEKAVLNYLRDLALTAMPMQAAIGGADRFAAYFRQIAPLLAPVAGTEHVRETTQ